LIRRLIPCAVAATAMLAGGCGGSTPQGNTPVTTPPAQATRTVLFTGAAFSLRPGTATYKNIDLPPNGTLDTIVDWAGANDINLYVTDNACAGFQEMRAGACPVIVKADSPSTRPERLSWSTTTAAGKIWTVWIHNNGTSMENGTMEVGITTTEPVVQQTPTTLPSAVPGGNPTSNLAAGPVVRYTIKLRSIDVDGGGGQRFRDPYQNDLGQWVVHPDEFVVFDSTQKNAGGELCRVENYPPRWSIEEDGGIDVLAPREGQNNPFLLRVDVRKKGSARVRAVVDGVESNELEIVSQTR
jgi:hypothetical protein